LREGKKELRGLRGADDELGIIGVYWGLLEISKVSNIELRLVHENEGIIALYLIVSHRIALAHQPRLPRI